MTYEQAMAKRAEVQSAATEQAIKAFNDGLMRVGLVIGTGVGKSKMALDILHSLIQRQPPQDLPILIAVSATDLRDSSWYTEIEKFQRTIPNLMLECYQTLYQWKDRKFYAVIADEGDFALTEEYGKFFANNDLGYLLFMTAFVTENKIERYKEVVQKTAFHYTTQQAQKDGILNLTKFIEVRFPVGHTRTRRVEYKKEGRSMAFTQSENAEYSYLEKKYKQALFAYRATQAKLSGYTLLEAEASEIEALEKELNKHFAKMKMYAGKRKTLLHTLSSSSKVARELITKIHSRPGNKVLVFSTLTEQSAEICEFTYNGGTVKQDNLSKFNEGLIKTLGVSKKVNRGVNLDQVNVLIKESYVGSDTDFQQQHGRGVRLRPDQTMYFIVMVPYYYDKVKVKNERGVEVEAWVMLPTQAAEWVETMTNSFVYNPEIIVMDHDPRQDKYTLPIKYHDNFCYSG